MVDRIAIRPLLALVGSFLALTALTNIVATSWYSFHQPELPESLRK